MLWTDLFLLWNRISHITRYLLPVNARKHCISNSLKYHASPHFLYRPIDIITLLYDMPLGVTVSIKKRSQQFIHTLLTSHTTHFILVVLFFIHSKTYSIVSKCIFSNRLLKSFSRYYFSAIALNLNFFPFAKGVNKAFPSYSLPHIHNLFKKLLHSVSCIYHYLSGLTAPQSEPAFSPIP